MQRESRGGSEGPGLGEGGVSAALINPCQQLVIRIKQFSIFNH